MIGAAGGLIGERGAALQNLSSFLYLPQARGNVQILLAAAAQRAATVGQLMKNVADGVAIAGFFDNARQTLTGLNQQVGGVLFDHCEAVLTGIEDVVGAYWDEGSKSIVLFGTPQAGGERPELPLPAMDSDNLKVALRATVAGQALGVSIDPPAEYRYEENGGKMLPDRTRLLVSYLGNTAETLLGAIMFESDRIMKCLSVGIDNKTRRPIQCHVPGYSDLFTTTAQSGLHQGASWHRFWFAIDSVKLTRSSQSRAVLVSDVQIKVLTELDMPNAPKGHAVDPNDRAFAEHLTKNYESYAEEFPVLARLKELAKVSAIARFLVSENVRVDIAQILQHAPARVATPKTTPSILRSASAANSVHMMSGGVEFTVEPQILPDLAGKAKALHRAVAEARPESATVWSVPAAKQLEARSIRLVADYGFRCTIRDHVFPATPGTVPLALERIYDSSRRQHGAFGPGWDLCLPYSLETISTSGKRAEVRSTQEKQMAPDLPPLLILRETRSGTAELYRPTPIRGSASATYARVISQQVNKGGVSFQCDPADVIHFREFCFSVERGANSYRFSLDGRLLELRTGCHAIRFTYDAANQLARIADNGGHVYEFVRCQEVPNVITCVQSAGGPSGTLRFVYDDFGYLIGTEGDGLATHQYRYGLLGQLAEIRDTATGACRAVPQQDLAVTEDTVQLPFGSCLRRRWKNGILLSVNDEVGSRAEFTYSAETLRRIAVHGPGDSTRIFEFETDGHLQTSATCEANPVHASATSYRNARVPKRTQFKSRPDAVSITRVPGDAHAVVVHFGSTFRPYGKS
jgi:YD repeat-containing protein